jgi:hypothetical protein
LEASRLKLKPWSEFATSITVIVAALAVLAIFIRQFSVGHPSVASLESGLVKEATLAALPGLNYSDSPQTLVIAAKSGCGPCIDSTGFYNELGKLEKAESGRICVVAVFPNSATEVRDYVTRTSLDLHTIANVDFQALKVVSTPVIILVDKTGRIVDFWSGKLPSETERQLLRKVGG